MTQYILAALLIATMFFALVSVNVRHRGARRKMTPEQRAEEDAEMQTW